MLFLPRFAFAASQVVTNNNNSGAGSLRQAILDIESSGSDGDTITFNLSAGNETITISSQFALIWQKNFTIDGDNTAGSGTNVTIQVTTPGSSSFRIFEIRPYSGTYLFKNMTLYGGNVSTEYGGTIKVYSGDSTGNLTLDNVIIDGSKAMYGGCVYAWGTMGTLTITNSTFTNCQATNASPYGGGALFMRSVGTINISSSSFTNNSSIYQGGGIYMFDQTFTMDKITVTGNSASNQGGGIYLDGDNALAIATLTNSTIANNTSSSHGGGLLLYYGRVQITNSTISSNTSSGVGGGFYSGYGSPYLTNVTLANNNSTGGTADGVYHEGGSTLYMKNTILANNGTGYDMTNNATVSDSGYNIVENSSGKTFNATGDIAGNQANLNLDSTLADNSTLNGTQTLALASGSVAIDAGNSTTYQSITIPSTDQRGLSRSGTLDIGAYEYAGGGSTPTPTPTNTPTPTPTPTNTPTPTPAPTSTPTPTPTNTQTPTPTNTPSPTSTPTPTVVQTTSTSTSETSSKGTETCPSRYVECPNTGPIFQRAQLVTSDGVYASHGQFFLNPLPGSMDLVIKIDQQNTVNLLTKQVDVPVPWQQGYNTAGEIFSYNAKSAFNGYPVTTIDSPAIIILPYDPNRLFGRTPDELRIGYYNQTLKRWEIIQDNTVVDTEKHTVANTTRIMTYYAVVYPRTNIIPPVLKAASKKTKTLGVKTKCGEYIVEAGDSLWTIAEEFLGKGENYKSIREKNKKQFPSLEKSTMIKPGWKLQVGC